MHELTYEAALREIGEVSPAASMSIRDAAGPSVKSSLSACFWRDTRDDPFIATRGHFAKLKAEYAGLGGDANFAKLEAEHSVSRPLIPTTATAAAPPRMMNGWIVSFASRAGLLCPLSGSAAGSSSSHFVDRFHLGGPTSVRMFRQNGMGPRDNGPLFSLISSGYMFMLTFERRMGSADRIGGDAYWAAGASLMTPIPTKEHWPLMTHFFVNAGRLTSYKRASCPPLFLDPDSDRDGFRRRRGEYARVARQAAERHGRLWFDVQALDRPGRGERRRPVGDAQARRRRQRIPVRPRPQLPVDPLPTACPASECMQITSTCVCPSAGTVM